MEYTPQIYAKWNLISNFKYNKPIEIYIDVLPSKRKSDDIIRIIQIQESHNTGHIVDFVKNNRNEYDYVFTYYDEILNTNDKATKFLCINTWIENYNFPLKKFGVSTLVGGKNFNGLIGHGLRHVLWERRFEIKIDKYFYLSSHYKYQNADYTNNLILGDKKDPLFDTMFHIVIENTSINNVFTEKLIDSFQTKTIPIYWGASNIGEFFNIKGMYLAKNIDEIIYICNKLTLEDYKNRESYIEENYQKSMMYRNQTDILDRKLNELLYRM